MAMVQTSLITHNMEKATMVDQACTPCESVDAEGQNGKSDLFRHQFSKTVLCRFHAAGKCRKGKDCTFAHTTTDLNVAPDLTKTSICKAWKTGRCSKSSQQCQFAHGAHELRMTPLFRCTIQATGKDGEKQKAKASRKTKLEKTPEKAHAVPNNGGIRRLSVSEASTMSSGPGSDQGDNNLPDSDTDCGFANYSMMKPTPTMSPMAPLRQAPTFPFMVCVPSQVVTSQKVDMAALAQLLKDHAPEYYED
jgi:hypothetical protein